MGPVHFGSGPKEDGERLTRPFKVIDGRPGKNVPVLCKGCEKWWDERNQPSFAFTVPLTFLPSTVLPASPAMTAFMTLPMSLALAAPVSAMAAVTAEAISSSDAAAGRYASRTDLGLLLVGQVLASALRELLDRIAALLHQHRHDLQFFRALERAAFLDVLVRKRGLEHAQRRELRLILGFHRRDDVGAERLFEMTSALVLIDVQSSGSSPSPSVKCQLSAES